jgi:ribosome biogenesis GTPase A
MPSRGKGGKRGPNARSVPFSGKAKKEYLKAKRERKAKEDAEEWEKEFGDPHSEAEEDRPKLIESLGDTGQVNKLSTLLARASDRDVKRRRKLAELEVAVGERGAIVRAPEPSVEYATIAHPRRSSISSAEVEEAQFAAWVDAIYRTYHPDQLSAFEHNLEVWRQLWRTIEGCHTVVLVADVRDPLFHIPESLYRQVTEELKKPLIVALTKVDLVPPAVVDDWVRDLKGRFPKAAAIVPFTACASTAGVETRLAPRRRSIREGMRSYDRPHKEARARGATALLEAAGASASQLDVVRRGIMMSSGTGRGGAQKVLEGEGSGSDSDGDDGEEEDAPAPSSSVGPKRSAKEQRRIEKAEEYRARVEAHASDARAAVTVAPGYLASPERLAEARAVQVAQLMGAVTSEAPPGPEEEDTTPDYDWSDVPDVILGVVGHPNVGKSSLINAITGAKRVSVSRTPGHTKRMQHIAVCPGLTVLDCPGLLFPHCYGPSKAPPLVGPQDSSDDDEGVVAASSAGKKSVVDALFDGEGRSRAKVQRRSAPPPGLSLLEARDWRGALDRHRAMQECLGVVPLSQVREPYTSVRLIGEMLPIEALYGLNPKDKLDPASPGWTAWDLCEAFAIKSGIFYAKTGRPDAHAAGRRILQDAVDGVLPLFFGPPASRE